MERELLIKGKTKEAYNLGNRLEFRFTDNVSVFDKVIPSLIPYKGETLCREGVYWFKQVGRIGIKTHFLEYLPPNRIICKKVNIIQPNRITKQSKLYLIPLEFICRWYVAGSLFDRVKAGEISAGTLGFTHGYKVTYGEPLPEPFMEVSTKLEETDRLLNEEDALEISGLTAREFDEAREIVLKIDREIGNSVESRGLIHVDGKKELAFDEDRQIIVVDVFGTADEDRFWDKARYEEGDFLDLSKEYVRQYYRQIGYKDQLYAARAAGSNEPPIPALPKEIIEKTRDIYIRLFKMITGEEFRPLTGDPRNV